MAKITPKDNFMRIVAGGMPEYVPVYTMMGDPYLGEVADVNLMAPVFKDDSFSGGKDMWGVPQAQASSGTAAYMPDTSFHLFDDIEDWSKAIKFPETPDVNSLDWHAMYENGIKMFNIDREQSCVKCGPSFMPFQELVAMMGFENGLSALYTDPEEVLAMLMAMVDVVEPVFTRVMDEFKPDMWSMGDDTCAKETPFFSPAIYEQVFLPVYQRLAKPAFERGIPIIFHNCGKIDEFMDFMISYGVKLVEPVQETNDLPALKEKYKGKCGFIGGWDYGVRMPKNYPEYDEEEFRAGIREIIDKNSVGGGYGFFGWPISYPGDPVCEELKHIMRDEAHWYCRKVYGYTGD